MMDEKENLPIPAKEIALKGRCICSWPDCGEMQREFTNRLSQGIPDLRAGNCFSLDLSGNSKKAEVFRNSVLSNIRCMQSDLRLDKVLVARHHWSVEQLEYFKSQRKKPSTPVSEKVL